MVMPHRCKPWYRVKPVTRRRLPCRLVGSLGERFAILLRGQARGSPSLGELVRMEQYPLDIAHLPPHPCGRRSLQASPDTGLRLRSC